MNSDIPAHWVFADPEDMLALARDLERIQRGTGPSFGDLDKAPLLVDWKLHMAKVPNLIGIGLNHPTLKNGPIMTSPLMAIDRSGTWARTKSRWYRLAVGPDGPRDQGDPPRLD